MARVGVGITLFRNGDIGGRKVRRLWGRRKVCLGKGRALERWKLFLWIDVGTRDVRFVAVSLALVGIGTVRNGSIGGRNAGLWRRRKRATGRGRREVLGRRTYRGPLVRRWSLRECESSRKADKNECRDDFQLHLCNTEDWGLFE